MKSRLSVLLIVGCLLLPGVSGAALFEFSGNITYQTDVVFFNFSTGASPGTIRLWTDSFQNGLNFDPITALWTSTGALIAQNDDNPTINPSTQTYWDSGFTLPSLAAGDYILSVAAYSNFAIGPTLANGFSYDGLAPIPIQQHWIGGAGYFHVNLDGVETATSTNPVPEPGTMMLLGSGLVGLAGYGRKRLGLK